MSDIAVVPELGSPTERVRESFLAAARELAAEGVLPDFDGDQAAADFAGYVREHGSVRQGWGVPYSELWYVAGAEYLGTVVVRHRLTPELRQAGGHVGYHVAPRQRRRGYATRMLHDALEYCRALGITRVLVVASEQNAASRRVIESNGGLLEDIRGGECRYWIATSGGPEVPPSRDRLGP